MTATEWYEATLAIGPARIYSSANEQRLLQNRNTSKTRITNRIRLPDPPLFQSHYTHIAAWKKHAPPTRHAHAHPTPIPRTCIVGMGFGPRKLNVPATTVKSSSPSHERLELPLRVSLLGRHQQSS